MSVEAAEQLLGVLRRAESLFAAPDGEPVLRVQPAWFGTGGAPPDADTGFTTPDGTRTPAEGGPLTGVVNQCGGPGGVIDGFTDIGLADDFYRGVAPHLGDGTGPPLGPPLDRWSAPDIQTPEGSISIAPGTEPKPPPPGRR
jgi:hypothetical protein